MQHLLDDFREINRKLEETSEKEQKSHLYMDMIDVTKQGVMGNPFASSAERGEKIVNHLVDACCEMVKIIKENDTHI